LDEPPPASERPLPEAQLKPIEIPTQTPLYHSMEQARYVRQDHIKAIEARTGRRLICYVAGSQAGLSDYDVPPFVDLLHDIDPGAELDLLLHTTGGDIDQAERIVLLCRKTTGDAAFRVVVADSAKSAGTLIAIAADEIIMGPPSELGPIDPQITITTFGGETISRPAQSYLDGLEEIVKSVGEGKLPSAYFPLLDKLDPALIDFCKKAQERSLKFAEQFLMQYMLKDDPAKAKDVAAELNNVKKYLAHSAVIDADRAIAMGLKVKKLAPRDDLWEAYWRLYLEMRLALRAPDSRLYESRRASLLL
jgi:hypothetical protein